MQEVKTNKKGVYEIEVKPYRGKYALFAGKVRLSRLFKAEELAKKELEDNYSFYHYWGNSASVSCQNVEPVIVKI